MSPLEEALARKNRATQDFVYALLLIASVSLIIAFTKKT